MWRPYGQNNSWFAIRYQSRENASARTTGTRLFSSLPFCLGPSSGTSSTEGGMKEDPGSASLFPLYRERKAKSGASPLPYYARASRFSTRDRIASKSGHERWAYASSARLRAHKDPWSKCARRLLSPTESGTFRSLAALSNLDSSSSVSFRKRTPSASEPHDARPTGISTTEGHQSFYIHLSKAALVISST